MLKIKKSIILVSILFISLACEKDTYNGGGGYGGGGSIPSSTQFNQYLNEQLTSEQRCQLETDNVNHPLEHPVISPKGRSQWKEEWSKNISNDLDDPALNELMNVSLKNDELRELNCPKFNSMNSKNKKMFWTILMASMSSAESSFKTKEFYKERGTNDSYGLLQIDAPNSRAHGCIKRDGSKPNGGKKGKSSGGDMYDPDTNLRCGMYILRNQLRKSGRLFYRSSYWAVLRTSRPGHQRFKRYFKTHIQQLKGCRSEGESGEDSSAGNQCVAVNDAPRIENPMPIGNDEIDENDELGIATGRVTVGTIR